MGAARVLGNIAPQTASPLARGIGGIAHAILARAVVQVQVDHSRLYHRHAVVRVYLQDSVHTGGGTTGYRPWPLWSLHSVPCLRRGPPLVRLPGLPGPPLPSPPPWKLETPRPVAWPCLWSHHTRRPEGPRGWNTTLELPTMPSSPLIMRRKDLSHHASLYTSVSPMIAHAENGLQLAPSSTQCRPQAVR